MTIGTEIENDVARIENLRVRFSTDQGDFDAVKKACLTIDQGEILALVGENLALVNQSPQKRFYRCYQTHLSNLEQFS